MVWIPSLTLRLTSLALSFMWGICVWFIIVDIDFSIKERAAHSIILFCDISNGFCLQLASCCYDIGSVDVVFFFLRTSSLFRRDCLGSDAGGCSSLSFSSFTLCEKLTLLPNSYRTFSLSAVEDYSHIKTDKTRNPV